MEDFKNQNTKKQENGKQILATARIVELFKEENDFEEFAGLNFLSQQLEGLSENQFTLCREFIEREYEKINISKKERSDYVDHFYLRSFMNHSILREFKEEKLTLILQFILKHEDIDLCIQRFYDDEVKVIRGLGEMSEGEIVSILLLDEEAMKGFVRIMKSNPGIIEFLIKNIDNFTNEQVLCIRKINELGRNYIGKHDDICVDIFGLLFLNKGINIKQRVEKIFEFIQPQFLYDVYNEYNETDRERVDLNYYREQLEKMQNDYLNQEIDKENFIKYLKGNYIKKKVFRAGDVWMGR